jgi:signal transduction histidine kinase
MDARRKLRAVTSPRATSVARMALLAAAYVALAKVGLGFASVGKSVTLVWPPTGLALAALLLGSPRLWPGVALGAFLANVTTPGVGVLTAAAIAAGNTLEAVVGAVLVRRGSFRPQLDRTSDVVRFALGGCGVGTAVSATVGALTLCAAGVVPARALPHTFSVWWVGDAMGALLVAPALLSWGAPVGDDERRPAWERPALAAALVLAALGALTQPHGTRPYLVFPPLIWAALRFGPRGATAATLVISVVTVWSTVVGHGAFAVSSLGDDLMALHAFMASVALTGLVLGATAAERTRAIRAREHFISIASHELRTPLAPLRLQVQRLLRGLRRDPSKFPPETVLDALVVMDRQVERLTSLLEDVLDLTRLRLGRLPLAPEEVDLGALVDDVAGTLRESLAQAGCSLRVERRGSTRGYWDRGRIGQVVTNLLINAMKHGGGGAIEVTVEGASDATTVVVRDHGPGVRQTDRERIFGRFEHTSAKREGDGQGLGLGLGLGLYIAREIVEAHRGRLSVENPPLGGAAFRVELPMRPGGAGRNGLPPLA